MMRKVDRDERRGDRFDRGDRGGDRDRDRGGRERRPREDADTVAAAED
jgi:hypothetical protein